jgi:hypothetical protein
MSSGTAVAIRAEQKQTCVIPFEWCLTGCPELGAYSIESFSSTSDEQAFVAALTGLQQETVRVAMFPANGKHIVVAYRVLAGAAPHATATIGVCPTSTVALHSYFAIETATVEATRLSIEQRSSIALFSVFPVNTNDPNTRALLVVRQEAEHGDID